jgi:hypothetical protein
MKGTAVRVVVGGIGLAVGGAGVRAGAAVGTEDGEVCVQAVIKATAKRIK